MLNNCMFFLGWTTSIASTLGQKHAQFHLESTVSIAYQVVHWVNNDRNKKVYSL